MENELKSYIEFLEKNIAKKSVSGAIEFISSGLYVDDSLKFNKDLRNWMSEFFICQLSDEYVMKSCLVLWGDKRIGKSFFLKSIVPDYFQYTKDSSFRLGGLADVFLSYFLFEIEIDKSCRNLDYITSINHVWIREPYSLGLTSKKRRSLIAATSSTQPDITGEQYLIHHVISFNQSVFLSDVLDMAWAEALFFARKELKKVNNL